jgi:hypothetical protein
LHNEAPQNGTAAYRFLIAAVLKNAIAGLGGTNPDQAMAFFFSETCEAYCAECGIKYGALRDLAGEIYRAILD